MSKRSRMCSRTSRPWPRSQVEGRSSHGENVYGRAAGLARVHRLGARGRRVGGGVLLLRDPEAAMIERWVPVASSYGADIDFVFDLIFWMVMVFWFLLAEGAFVYL